MKGIIFNVVEEVVSDQFGPGVWDELLSKTALSGIYTSLGSYPDEQLFDLVGAASEMTGKPATELLKTLGRRAMPRLHGRFPKFFEDVPGARPFILSLNTIIHPEVRKLYSGAGCPHFHFAETASTVTLGYNSPRKLCHLAHGFVLGLADLFDETIEVDQPVCMHEGASMCQIELTWK